MLDAFNGAINSCKTESEGKSLDLALLDAIERADSTEVSRLIAKNANPNTPDDEGMTSLHHAAGLGDRGCIRVLVNSGACNYLIRDNYGRYASDLAIEWARDFGIARLLSTKRRQQAFVHGVPAYVAR